MWIIFKTMPLAPQFHGSPFPLLTWFSSFYFQTKRGSPLFLCWQFYALLLHNKNAAEIGDFSLFSRGFFMLPQKVILIHGIFMKKSRNMFLQILFFF